MNVIGAGTAILLAEAPLYKAHLWIVLTDPHGQPPAVVAVMVRTVTKFTDETLVLQPGDHPFIKHESSVHYSTARFFDVHSLQKALEDGRCHLRDTLSANLLERARQGLLKSPFTVHAVANYCLERFASE